MCSLPTLDRLRMRGEIRIGFQRHTPPFSYATREQWPIGYSVALATEGTDALALRLGAPLRMLPVEVTSSTRTARLISGEIDIECGSTTITEARQRQVAFSRPIFHTAHRLALKARRSLSSPHTLRVTGITGSTSHRALLDASGGRCTPHFVGRPSIGEAFDAFVEDDEIDGIVADEVILAGLMRRAHQGGLVLAGERLGSEHYGFMMRHADHAFHDAVNHALGAVLQAPDFARRYARWFDRPLPGLGFSLGLDFERQLPHLTRPGPESAAGSLQTPPTRHPRGST